MVSPVCTKQLFYYYVSTTDIRIIFSEGRVPAGMDASISGRCQRNIFGGIVHI